MTKLYQEVLRIRVFWRLHGLASGMCASLKMGVNFTLQPIGYGWQLDFSHEPLMKHVDCHVSTSGLPVLNDDLSLSTDNESTAKMYVMGAYAAMTLGPGALNLMGAKDVARRIA